MKNFLAEWVLNGVSLAVIDLLLKGIRFSGAGAVILTAFALTLLNMTLKPFLKIISIPATVLTLGLFSLVLNGIILWLAFHLSSGAYMKSLGTGVWAALILTIINGLLTRLFQED